MQKDNKEHIYLNLARLKKKGQHVEIDVDPDAALKFKAGKEVTIQEVLRAPKVFTDAQKGLAASDAVLKDLFNTTDPYEVASIIIKEGEIQLTAEYRAQLREAKRRKLIEIIHRNGIDPVTKLPHPVQRIELAMDEAKVRIDEHKRAEDQVKDIVHDLQSVLPISFVKKEIWLSIPAEHAAKTYSLVKSSSTILKEEWQNNGSWEATVEIPGGLQEEFYDKLNKATKGEIETKVVKEK
jgi:ribosome maturation protein SDO1